MLDRIVYASVFVTDQDRALDFYTNVLGLEKRIDSSNGDGPRFLTVGVSGQDFQLVLWPGTPGKAQPIQGAIPATYTIETPDIRKAFEALRSRGVNFETEVREFPWGSIAVFQDPDGNRLHSRRPPASSGALRGQGFDRPSRKLSAVALVAPCHPRICRTASAPGLLQPPRP